MFQTIFYQPILNLVVFLYNIVPGHDLGLAIIVLTIIIRMVLWPLSQKSIKAQKSLQELQPKIDEIKKKYAKNKEKMGIEIMELYKKHRINPLSSCLPLLIQFPFLWAVFRVFRNGFENGNLDLVYSFIYRPDVINSISFGFLDLSKPHVFLAILAGGAQFWQAKMMSTKKPKIDSPGAKDENMATMINKQMLYMMPAITVFIGLTLPGGLTLYWFVTTVLTVLQQLIIFKKKNRNENNNDSQDKNIIEGEIIN